MTDERHSRTLPLLGEEGLSILRSSHVMLFGLGGVGGYALEALVRCGVGELTLVDADSFSVSNLNRQLLALESTVGRRKTTVAAERARAISSSICVHECPVFVEEGTAEALIRSAAPDYVIDAIDTVGAKVGIIAAAKEQGIPVVSCMGTGNKLDPEQLHIVDIARTDTCPLARAVRNRLRRRGILHVDVLSSSEKPAVSSPCEEGGRPTPASLSFVPAVAGLLLAGHVIRALTGKL